MCLVLGVGGNTAVGNDSGLCLLNWAPCSVPSVNYFLIFHENMKGNPKDVFKLIITIIPVHKQGNRDRYLGYFA